MTVASTSGWDIVGCSDCHALWLVKRADRRSQDRMECPECATTHATENLRPLAGGDTKDDAADVRAQILADRAGEAEAYGEMDDYGAQAEQVDARVARAVTSPDPDDLRPVATDRYADAAEAVLGRRDRRFEEQAERVLGTHDDKFADLVDADCPDWRTEPLSDEVQESIDEWSDDAVVDERTGDLVLDTQYPADAIATVTLDEDTTVARSSSERPGLWADLLQTPAVQEEFVAGVQRFADGRTASELAAGLEARDVAYPLRTPLVRLAHGVNRGVDTERTERRLLYGDEEMDGLLYWARRLGTQRAPVEAVLGTARLVAWASEGDDVQPPTIEVQLAESFREQSPDQRDRVVSLLWQLARHSEVVVVADPIDLRWLAVAHDLGRTAFNERWTGRGRTAPIDERADRAVEAYDRDDTAARILRILHNEHDETLSYGALMDALDVSKATISNWVQRNDTALTELGLVETVAVGDETYVELSPAGREAIETIDTQTTRQQRLDEALTDPLHPSDHGRVTPPTREAPHGTDPRRKGTGLAPVSTMSRSHAHGAAASARENGFSLVDQPVEKTDDYRVPKLWVDSDRARVVTSTEYVNPMQYWVSTARSLTHSRVFKYLVRERLSSENFEFSLLFEEHRQVLRSSRCLGHLSDGFETVDGFISALQDARDDLEDLTSDLHDGEFEDESTLRSTITREALGLAGTMAHVFDLIGVDLVREVRLPTFSSDFDSDRWEKLVRTMAIGAAIQSEYSGHVPYRQLFERREEKLDWAAFVDVDAADPVGTLIGSFVLVGNFGDPDGEKREAFVEDLRKELNEPSEVRDDAPEFAVEIPVRAFEFDREQFALATAWMADQKNLRVTRNAVSTLRLFTGTPYDVTAALDWLKPEDRRRDLRVGEVRFALAHLPTDRLVPHCTAGARAIVKALLVAEAPLSTADLAEMADVSRSTITGRSDSIPPGDRLVALGLAERTDDGRWRLALSFRDDDERYETIVPDVLADDRQEFVRDVFYEAVLDLIDDTSRFGDPSDPVCGCWIQLTFGGVPDLRSLVDRWEWLDPWVPILEDTLDQQSMLADVDDNYARCEYVASFGQTPSQTSLQASASGGVEA